MVDIRGHEVAPEQLQKIGIGVSTKEQISKLLGTPSVVSPFDNNTWYYMFEETERRAFFTPSVVKSSTIRITFNDQNQVISIDSVADDERQDISPNPRTERTAGYSDSILKQIFGNVGRFNGKDPDK